MTDYIHLRCLDHDPAIKSQALHKHMQETAIEMLRKREEIIALSDALENADMASLAFPTDSQLRIFEFIANHPKCTMSIWKGDHQITGAYTPKAGK